ncbi:MAG: T9SS type A sorting domain-containing protein [Bacteroidia bacterium]|nr:T9SS type A sorting domain-containing protein [Bacteroidia bacterium]
MKLKAVNVNGDGAESAASNSVTPVTAPDAPTSLVATAGDTRISVAFTAGSPGSSPITNYKFSTDGGTTFTACAPAKTTSPIVLTALTNTTAYTIKLKAVNSYGDGTASGASNEVTPDATANDLVISSPTNSSALTLTPVSDLVVSSNLLTIDLPTAVNSITVAAGAKLTVSGTNTLSATNGITLQSDATGTGTLVDNTTSSPQAVTATVQQYLPQGRNWYVSSPITAGTASVFTAVGTADSVSYYNEAGSAWVNNYTGSLTPGRGYIAVSNTGTGTNTVQFTGTLNTGTVNVSLSKQGSAKIGFNLVANPYPSYLNAITAINANANLVPTIWYRTRSTGGAPTYYFETVNTASGVGTNNAATGTVTGYIPPMQAFWVKTNLDAQTLTFENSMRYHAGNVTVGEGTVPTTPLKAPRRQQALNIKQQLLRLQVSNGTANDEAVVYLNANAANGFDTYDSPKMSNASKSIPEIYTMAGTEKLVINGLSSAAPSQELALGFTPGAVNTFSIKATEVSNFDADMRIILKDSKTNTELDLTDGSGYTFISDASSTASRFTIVFRSSSAPTVIKETVENSVVGIFSNANNQIALSIPTELVGKARVVVYNTLGQRLESMSLTNAASVLNNSYTKGIYVVSVLANGKTITRKVVIN